MGGLSLKEETVREKNEKAAKKQTQHQEHAEVTVRDGEFAGLTKRNEDFMFHLNKAPKSLHPKALPPRLHTHPWE